MFPFPLTSLLLLLSQHAVSTSAAALQARASPSATAISPVVFPPSQNWDGDDGPWSSFALRLGNPAQVVRVLPATAGTFTTVVLPLGCNTTSNPIACAEARGKLFDPTQSKTWQDKGPFGLGVENNLGYSPVAGEFGIDSEGFTVATLPNLTYPNQIIAGIAVNDFYVGTFGLGTQPTNFSTFEDTHPSFFTSLRNNNNTPSYTWSYTAGAQYQLTGVLGTLVFGGYDSSLFIPNNLSIPMSPDVSRDLVVGVQGITLSSNTSAATTNLLPSGGIFSFVDSTLPYIWLPLDACQAFERAFGLTWNETHELYLVNDTLRTSLQNRNLSVTFTLGVGTSDGETVDITLPYAAFDKTATPPLVPSTTGYFPLKRAANATQYTLGRTFLQEAYLIADYERNNFSLSQCQFIPGAKQNIVTIRSLADETAPTGDTGSNKLSGGAIAGIVIAPLVVLPGIFFIFAYKRKVFIFKEKPADMAELSSDEAGPSRDQNAAPSAFAATAAAAAGTDGAHTDPTSPELEGATPKPAVEAMSKPVGSEMEANDLTGFYAPKRAEMEGEPGRAEMEDSTPAATELGTNSSNAVHEMFDESVYRELGNSGSAATASSQPRARDGAPSERPFSFVETPLSALQSPILPAYRAREDENGTWSSTLSSGFGTSLAGGLAAAASSSSHPVDRKEPIEEEPEQAQEPQAPSQPQSPQTPQTPHTMQTLSQTDSRKQAHLAEEINALMSSSSGPVPEFSQSQHQEGSTVGREAPATTIAVEDETGPTSSITDESKH